MNWPQILSSVCSRHGRDLVKVSYESCEKVFLGIIILYPDRHDGLPAISVWKLIFGVWKLIFVIASKRDVFWYTKPWWKKMREEKMKLWIPKKYYDGVYLCKFTWNVRIYMTKWGGDFFILNCSGACPKTCRIVFFIIGVTWNLHGKFTFSTLYGHNLERVRKSIKVNGY